MSTFFIILFEIFVRLLILGVTGFGAFYLVLAKKPHKVWGTLLAIVAVTVLINLVTPSSYSAENRITFQDSGHKKAKATDSKKSKQSHQSNNAESTKKVTSKKKDIPAGNLGVLTLPNYRKTTYWGKLAVKQALNNDDQANESLGTQLEQVKTKDKYTDKLHKSYQGKNADLGLKLSEFLGEYINATNEYVTSIQMKSSDQSEKKVAYEKSLSKTEKIGNKIDVLPQQK